MINYKKSMTGFMALLLSGSLLLSGCGSDNKKTEKATQTSSQKESLTFCSSGTFSTMDPGSSSKDAFNIKLGHDGLVGFKKQSAEPEPRLAESWDISDDGKTYTFHLRHGVKFHKTAYFTPSREMNADDVIFSFMRQMDKNSPYYRVQYTMLKATGIDKAIANIERIDDYTVAFHLTQPMATFIPNLLATYIFAIVSKEYFEKMHAEGKMEFAYHHPIGTGPWVYHDQHDGEYVRFKGNKEYWRTKVKSDLLTIKVVDASQYLNAIETGECDIALGVTLADKNIIDKYKNIKLTPQGALRTWHSEISFDKHPEYNNPLIMQAISHAINRQAIADQVFHGQAKPATSLIPPGMFAHLGDEPAIVDATTYDPEKAKELLAKAGHPNGEGLPELTYIVISYSADYRNVALKIQNDLGKIGIKLKLNTMEFGAMLELADKHDYDMTGLSWGADYPDPDNFYSNLIGEPNTPTNYPNWKNAEFEKLRLLSQTVSNEHDRLEVYRKMTKLFAKHMPMFPLVYNTAYVAMRKNLQGYFVGPIDGSDALPEVYKD